MSESSRKIERKTATDQTRANGEKEIATLSAWPDDWGWLQDLLRMIFLSTEINSLDQQSTKWMETDLQWKKKKKTREKRECRGWLIFTVFLKFLSLSLLFFRLLTSCLLCIPFMVSFWFLQYRSEGEKRERENNDNNLQWIFLLSEHPDEADVQVVYNIGQVLQASRRWIQSCIREV